MYIPVAQRKEQTIRTGYTPVAQRENEPFSPLIDIGTKETAFSTPSVLSPETTTPQKAIGGFLKEVGQSTARSIAATGLTIARKIAPKELKPQLDVLKADDMKSFFGQALFETVFGKDADKAFPATRPIEDQVAEAEIKIADWQKGFRGVAETPGLNAREKFIVDVVSNIDPKVLAFPAIMGQVGLDLTPFGGLEKGAYKAMIKAKTLGEAMSVLKTMGVADDLAEKFAIDVVRVADEKTAAKLFNNIAKLQQTTKAAKFPTKDIYVPVEKRVDPLTQEATKYKSAEDYLASKTLTTNGINHLDPKEYGNFTSFVRDIERLNDGSRPVDEIKLAEKLWGDRPKQVVESINPKSIVLAEEPLKVLPKAGRQVTEPITVEIIDGVPTLVDGRHRLAQAIANGQETIPAKISGGSKVQKITDTYYQELIKTKGISKELQPLVEHAQKSKTFDDFVAKFKEEAGNFCIEL